MSRSAADARRKEKGKVKQVSPARPLGADRRRTDRKNAEHALRESEARFRQFAENSADVFWIMDTERQRFDYLSPSYEKIWGEPRELVMADLGHRLEVVHPEDRKRARAAMPRVLAGETVTIQYRIVRPSDGQIRWIRDTAFPIRNQTGETSRVAGVAQDVTEDRNRVEALAASEERFRLLVDGARDYAIFQLDPANRIIYWSAGAERIFGWSAQEALGRNGELIFTPEDRARGREEKELAIARREGCANDCRWHLRKDGSRIWVDGVMRRLDDENGNLRGFAKVARDATEQRLAEEKLKKSYALLEARVKERTADLTAANRKLQAEIAQRAQLEQEILLISEREQLRIGEDLHDILCQELAAAAFFLQSTAQKTGKNKPADAAVLVEAAKIVNANVGLARDLARGLHPVELTASGLMNALRELAFRTHDGVTCRFECPNPVQVGDEAIALNLYRIAQEAVTNALKHARPREIVISLERDAESLRLIVRDNGRGSAAKKSSKGLGIHIMTYRANALGGTLNMESKKGRGTTVTCTIPRG